MFIVVADRAGKSSKMSERGLSLGVKYPQTYVGKIPQDLS